jgi:hypothetical protein
MKNKSKYASGGAPKPMTMAERVADRNRRMAQAMGDAPKPKPKPAPKPQKPKPYAEGGMVATGMPAPQPRPSDFRVGPLQFGGAGGMGGYGGAGSPVGATGMPPGGPMGGGRPMRDQRGISGGNDMNFAQNMKQDIMQKMKDRLGDRMGGIGDRMEGIRNRVRPNAPAPVGPGGGYKKGGKIDGCATRGMTKARKV